MAPGIRALRERVAQAVGDGVPLEEVEQSVIEQAPLPAELRDALWLYAWGLAEREQEREEIPV